MAARGRPACVLFDAGGTLVQVQTDRLAAELSRRGHEPDELDPALWQTLVRFDDDSMVPALGDAAGWLRSWLAHCAEACGVPEEVFAEAWHAADAPKSLWSRLLPGVTECLTRLREAGIPLGVVSNADGRIAAALGELGLAPYFEVIVDSTEVGVAKPDPRIFDHALDAIEAPRHRTWYLGDMLTFDAAGADAAGLVSWVVDHFGLHRRPHPRRVRSLAEFADAALAG